MHTKYFGGKDEPFVKFEIGLTLSYCIFKKKFVELSPWVHQMRLLKTHLSTSYTRNGVGVGHLRPPHIFSDTDPSNAIISKFKHFKQVDFHPRMQEF